MMKKKFLYIVGGDKGWAIANRGKNLAIHLEKYFDIAIFNEWHIPTDINDYDIVHMHRPILVNPPLDIKGIWGFEIPSVRVFQLAKQIGLFSRANFVVVKNLDILAQVMVLCENNCDCRFIPNGVDCNIFKPKVYRIGWAGNDYFPPNRMEVKRTYLIQEACDLLNAELKGIASFQFVKDGSNYPTKVLSPKQMAEFYQSLDVFVMSSSSEGSSNVVLEALAAGVPVVTTEVGNWISLNYKDLVTIVLGTAEAIKNGIKRTIGNKLVRRVIIEDSFSWEKIAELYLDLYKSLGVMT